MSRFKSLKNILIVFLLSIFSMAFFSGCNEEEKYNVSFYIDDTYIETQETGDYVNYPNFSSNYGSVVDGWYIDDDFSEKFDFSSKITSDLSLYAKSLTYIEAFEQLVNENGEQVTASEVGLSGADGLAIELLGGGTGVNKTSGYLLYFKNAVYIIEVNRVDKYYHYAFIWNLETGIGSLTISEKELYRTKFITSFILNYEMNIKSIADSALYNTQVASDFIYQDGVAKTKKAMQAYLDQLDDLIMGNFII